MNRRQFLSTGLMVGSLLLACRAEGPTLESPLADQVRFDPSALATLYRQKVEELESRLQAVIEWKVGAVQRSGGPLSGLPILLKDNIDTGDGLVNSAGSLALAQHRPEVDAPVAARLRAAGAVLVGKANMSEWANFRSSRSSSGWSARGGQCRNPHVLDRTPCGSSSGSAAAVAAGLCAAAIGTETVGSIVCPSATCGVVGVKPTHGLVPAEGIIPLAPTQDTAGPITRTVADAALVLGIMAGRTYQLDETALEGARLGVARSFFGFDSRVDEVMERQLAELTSLGAVLVDPLPEPDWGQAREAVKTVLLYEFKASLNAYLEASGLELTLTDLIRFNRQERAEKNDLYGQDLFLQAEAKGPLEEPAYRKARELAWQLTREEGLARLLQQHQLDAIVSPTNGPGWVIDPVCGDHFSGGSAFPAAVAGFPHVTVPAGFVHQMPVGLSFYSGPHTEERLLSLAHHYERTTNHRRPPKFLPTLPLE